MRGNALCDLFLNGMNGSVRQSRVVRGSRRLAGGGVMMWYYCCCLLLLLLLFIM